MTDPELVAKKLAVIETCVADLRRMAHPEALAHVRRHPIPAITSSDRPISR